MSTYHPNLFEFRVEKSIAFVNSFGLFSLNTYEKLHFGTENINSFHGFAIFMADYG